LDGLLDIWRDRIADGTPFFDRAAQVALYRCERIAGIAVKVTATAEDETPDGERCRDHGHDVWVELAIEEEG
jgi:hypothetical protein